jgi:hypothetical protein
MSVRFDEERGIVHIDSPAYTGPDIIMRWPDNYWQYNDLVGGVQVIHAGEFDTSPLFYVYGYHLRGSNV